ncbi:hypothetical protein PV336_16280 [Streptomyces sp. MI02-2A]|uniref:hypothetical protein n=1 Tax=Streptomyces sp. MI02-2A TaxID=3028688 RepID=UPI0029B73B33|nr:hypothetical protein [Streptomyces sp. MI02-2A]MDX3260779.1 hypothetical protein [Streptomyces sp. MI02-2A]
MASGHEPVMVYAKDDEYRVGTPAEVCNDCSDFEAGVLVPASFCEKSNAKLGPAPWEG